MRAPFTYIIASDRQFRQYRKPTTTRICLSCAQAIAANAPPQYTSAFATAHHTIGKDDALKKVRFGIIGCGSMGRAHAHKITETKAKDFCLTAVADVVLKRATALGRPLGVECFKDGGRLIDSGLVDAVIIATPHYFHPPLAIHAARRGLHVLSEKPMGVAVGPVRAMIADCRTRRVALGVMFQRRTIPAMRKFKQLVDAGAVGEIFRVEMLCSSWYRTQSYYDSGDWRGSWAGEGGGILINQAPHSLDIFQWIGGMPKSVVATVDTRHHRIEVENTINAIFDYGNGKHGYMYATTAEAPGLDRFTVSGDKGTLVAEGGKLRLAKIRGGIKKHLLGAKAWSKPQCTWTDVALPKARTGHIEVVRAFAAHILRGTPLVADGANGINGLEISNAIYISGYRNRPVDFPVDGAVMDRLLQHRIRSHRKRRRGNLRKKAGADLRKLFGRRPV